VCFQLLDQKFKHDYIPPIIRWQIFLPDSLYTLGWPGQLKIKKIGGKIYSVVTIFGTTCAKLTKTAPDAVVSESPETQENESFLNKRGVDGIPEKRYHRTGNNL